jgi:hypothetical protein
MLVRGRPGFTFASFDVTELSVLHDGADAFKPLIAVVSSPIVKIRLNGFVRSLKIRGQFEVKRTIEHQKYNSVSQFVDSLDSFIFWGMTKRALKHHP